MERQLGGPALRRRGRGALVRRYHHGDLKAELLKAAEAELAEKGIAGFTLRGCARRAGVSHAAPAHHFADVTALLTEMAAVGFERLTAAMRHWRSKAATDTRSQFVAAGRGYIDFAVKNPQHFMLMFGGVGVDARSERLRSVGEQAFGHLLEVVSGMMDGENPLGGRAGRVNVIFAWSLVHGFAKLSIEAPSFERLIDAATPDDDVEISELLERSATALCPSNA